MLIVIAEKYTQEYIYPVGPSGYFMYNHVPHLQILQTAHTAYLFPFVGLSDQTAIVLLYNINWLVFITPTEYLLRGTNCIFNYSSWYSETLQG
jgi:hypothetical protein